KAIMKAVLMTRITEPSENLAVLKQRLALADDDNSRLLELIRLKRQNNISTADFKTQMQSNSKRFIEVLTDGQTPNKATFEQFIAGYRKLSLDTAERLTDLRDSHLVDAVNKLKSAARYKPDAWKDMLGVLDLKVGRSVQAKNAVLGLHGYIASMRGNSGLIDDCSRFMGLLTECSIELEELYEKYKKEYGYLDYTDMEAYFYNLVADPALGKEFSTEIELVVVDEFQDSNPIQLAIFMALSGLVKESIWVGDQKQTIFVFNGAAPDLMQAAWDDKSVKRETLGTNRRSAAGIIDIVNTVFTPVFGKAAAMQAHKEALPVAMHRWLLESKSNPKEAEALACGIDSLLKKEKRRYCDVVVLVRTNSWGNIVAKALEARGIPVSLALDGLLDTRECAAVLAGLYPVVDRNDSLAAATLLHMLEDDSAGTPKWFSERLAELAKNKGKRAHPFAGHKLFEALKALNSNDFSPSETVSAIIRALDLPVRIGKWDQPARRATHLDSLLAAAKTYEQEALHKGHSATLTGLIAYLEDLNDKGDDDREPPQGLDAVRVSTYHHAKGLEWPVVILSQLNKVFDGSMFQFSAAGGDAASGKPLKDRCLCYWPYPFERSKQLDLDADARSTDEAQAAAARDDAESQRLLYVGFTRPKEKLILATRVKDNKAGDAHETQWLNKLKDFEKSLGGLINPGTHKIEGVHGDIKVERFTAPEVITLAPPPKTQHWFSGYDGKPKTHAPRYRSPSAEPALKGDFSFESLPGEHPFPANLGKLDPETLGTAVHAYFSALPSLSGLAPKAKQACAQRILQGYSLTAALKADALVAAGERLESWVKTRFPNVRWRTEVPITAPADDGSQWNGSIDLLLELPDGSVAVLDHKSFFGNEPHLHERANEYTGQLKAYAEALKVYGKKVSFLGLHLPIGGRVGEMGGKY
ncbi:MAG: 3'-5' exonuclease, partial [Elusimicrobiota bacterium]